MNTKLATVMLKFYAHFTPYEVVFQKFLEFSEKNLLDIFAYTMLMKYCVSQKLLDESIGLFHHLIEKKIEPNASLFVSLFTLC